MGNKIIFKNDVSIGDIHLDNDPEEILKGALERGERWALIPKFGAVNGDAIIQRWNLEQLDVERAMGHIRSEVSNQNRKHQMDVLDANGETRGMVSLSDHMVDNYFNRSLHRTAYLCPAYEDGSTIPTRWWVEFREHEFIDAKIQTPEDKDEPELEINNTSILFNLNTFRTLSKISAASGMTLALIPVLDEEAGRMDFELGFLEG